MRTFKETQIEYYTTHIEELETYLRVSFEEFYEFDDIRILVRAITMVGKVKNIDIQVTPDWDSIMNALKVLGYSLTPKLLDKAA